MANNTIRVALLGNIAVGKSSATQLVSYPLSFCVPVAEPLDKCQKTGLFDLFYSDMRKYALEWQKLMVTTRQTDVQAATVNKQPHQMILMDGHMLTDRYAFVETLFEEGKLSLEEKKQYDDYYDSVIPNETNEVLIYFRCTPETALARARIRARGAEINLSLEYLKHLHEKLEEFVARPEIRERLFIVDVTKLSVAEVASTVSRILKDVYEAQGIRPDMLRYYTPIPESCGVPTYISKERVLFVN